MQHAWRHKVLVETKRVDFIGERITSRVSKDGAMKEKVGREDNKLLLWYNSLRSNRNSLRESAAWHTVEAAL